VATLFAIAAVTAGVPLLVLAAQRQPRRSPARSSYFLADWRGLRLQHAPTDKAALTLLLFIAGLATLVFTTVLSWLGNCYQAALPSGLYQRMPNLTGVSFLVPSIVLGILTGALATDFVLRLALRGRYGDYEFAFGGGGPGRPDDRGMPLLTLVVAVLVTAFVTLRVESYSRFEEERIVVNPFWGLGERSYPYGAVAAVVRASHVHHKGSEIPHTRYFILFADGRWWCNEDYGSPASGGLQEDADLAEFVCKRSDKVLTRVRHIEDVTGR
jgi:hypothetical protein